MVERQMCCRAYLDLGTFFSSVVKPVAMEAERWCGVKVGVSEAMMALQAGVKGRCDTAWGLTDTFDVARGLGQGCVNSPARAKCVIRLMQGAVRKLCTGFQFRLAEERVPQVWFGDDGAFLSESVHGLQLAIDTCWMMARAAGLQVKVKKEGTKTAWMATYWQGGKERDISGWEIRLPNGDLVPQVKVYKHLGSLETSTWREAGVATREKVRRRCTQMIEMIGRVPALSSEQMSRCMDLAVSGVIGYYGRSTPITWEDCEQIETVRARVVRQRGFAPGVPKLQVYASYEMGGSSTRTPTWWRRQR